MASEGWRLDPELGERMATSTDYDELAYVWKSWRDVAGKPIRDKFTEYVQLGNKGAVNAGTHWNLFRR